MTAHSDQHPTAAPEPITVPTTLPMHPDGSFTIAQFTDLHLNDGGPTCQQTVALLETVLELEQPDLVILTGDVSAATDTPLNDAAAAWRLALAPIVRRNLNWACVFGNHDDEGDLSRAQLMAFLQQQPGCVAEPGPSHLPGVGNYVIDLISPAAASGVRASASGQRPVRLYFLDSHAYGPRGVSRYDWIKTEQIEWFGAATQAPNNTQEPLNSSTEMKEDGAHEASGLVFFHIPLPEYELAAQAGQYLGNKLEKVCCPGVNSGMFAAMVQSGAVAGVFVGHDHVNDYESTLQGIRLCYGRASGYGSYGHDSMLRGARLIRLRAGEGGFESWLRLADGSVVQQSAA